MNDLSQALLRSFLRELLIPAMVSSDELEEVETALKQGAVEHVLERFGLDVDLAALHLGRSRRWIYRVLQEAKERQEAGATVLAQEPDGAAAALDSGFALMRASIQFYLKAGERALPASACARHLRKQGYKVNAVQLEALLDVYCKMGHLIRVSERVGGRDDIRYRVEKAVVTAAGSRSSSGRLKSLDRRLRSIFPIAQAYVRQEPDTWFSMLEGELLEDEYAAMVKDIREYAQARLMAAVGQSRSSDPEEQGRKVNCRLLLLSGTGPWMDPDPRPASPGSPDSEGEKA